MEKLSKKTIISVLIAVVPLAILVYYGVVAYRDRYCLLDIHGENTFDELATVVFFVIAGVFSLWNAVRWHRQERRWHWFFIGFGVLLFVGALEELNWGQHLLGFETPRFLAAHNTKQEANFHNFLGAHTIFVLYIPALVYGLLPLAANSKPVAALRRWGLLDPPSILLTPALVLSSLVDLRLSINPDDIATFGLSESAEMTYALSLAISMLIRWRELYQGPPRRERRELIAWGAVSLVTLGVIGAVGTVGMVMRHCHFPEYRALAALAADLSGPQDAIIFVGEPQDARIVLNARTRRSGNLFTLPDEQTLDSILETYDKILVINFRPLDPDNVIENTLTRRAYPLSRSWQGYIRVDHYLSASHEDDLDWQPGAYRFGDHITLVGIMYDPAAARSPGDAFGVALLWETDAPLDISYKVFVHVYNADGVPIAQHDSIPGSDLIPTTTWTPGEQVLDRHGILLPGDILPGTYDLALGLYDPVSGERLSVTLPDGTVGDRIYLEPLIVVGGR